MSGRERAMDRLRLGLQGRRLIVKNQDGIEARQDDATPDIWTPETVMTRDGRIHLVSTVVIYPPDKHPDGCCCSGYGARNELLRRWEIAKD